MDDQMKKKFWNITLVGRLCWIFLCVERYLNELYPSYDWTPIAERMWQWTDCSWMEGSEVYSEAVPEFIMEYSTYEETKHNAYADFLKRADYDLLTSLFRNFTDGSGNDEFCRLLKIPFLFCMEFDGDTSLEAEDIGFYLMNELAEILHKRRIDLPDVSEVEMFRYNRTDALEYGEPVNSEHLSSILNNKAR